MFDLDKLFAKGNHIGVLNTETNEVFYHLIDCESETSHWFDGYKNQELKSESVWVVYKIIQLDREGQIKNVLFDRKVDLPDPMPKLENGMFVHIHDFCSDEPNNNLGVIVGDSVIYQDGGFDKLSNLNNITGDWYTGPSYIDKIWKCKYGFSNLNDDCLIWSKG